MIGDRGRQTRSPIIPYQGTEFNLKGPAGRSLEFRLDAQGVCNEVVVTQPGAVHTARRR